jgi:O-antigen/teichoic acid export membrane protein
VAVGFCYAGVAFRLYPTLKIRLSLCNQQYLRMVFSFSIYNFLLQISFNLIFYTDSLVIGRFLSINLITFFAIAGNLMNYSRNLIGGISTTMTPRASALAVRGDLQEVQQLFTKATRLATLMVLPIALTFLLRGNSFVRLWMGREYADVSGHVLWILSLALIFVAAAQVATAIMAGIEKYRPVVGVGCCEALCNLVLSVALARSMGIFGVAWGTTLPSLAVSLFFWPWYVNRTLRIPVLGYFSSTLIRPGVSAIPFGLFSYEIERLWPAPNLFVFFLQVGVSFIIFLITSWYIGLTSQERRTYAQKFFYPASRTSTHKLSS